MNNFIFENPTKVFFGKGCVKEYLACLTKGCDTILLAYGEGSVRKNGVYDEVTAILKEAGKNIVTFSGIMPNPTYAKVLEGAKLAKEKQVEMILGVGGGSVMDCCKAVSIAARYEGDVWADFFARLGIFDFVPLPLGVIVTAVGTGSECNGRAVITNEEMNIKTGRDYPNCNHGAGLAVLKPSYYRHIYKSRLVKWKKMKMKTKKKQMTMVISVLLMLGLAACGKEPQAADSGAAKPSSEAVVQMEEESETAKEDTGDSSVEETEGSTNGKTLIVYYSASGNTKEAAEYIGAATGGDLFELEPVEAYTDEDLDWTDEDSRVCREHENEEERNVELVSAEVPDWDSYETVFVGYPIWWGIAAWPVNGFITANDFTGKTVIPFCTSASSGLGESGELLEEMAGTGNWLEGERFSSGVSEEDVKNWIDDLGLE